MPWGAFAYKIMLFGSIDAGATFQRFMDIDFRGSMHNSVGVYHYDITIHSKKRHDHLFSLR